MKITMINGSPKSDGFTHQALDIVASRLKKKNVKVEYVRLSDRTIHDCIGCFNCLRTGKCVIRDDMENITCTMMDSNGFVISSPVRNGLTTALYKKFVERITYPLGFTLALEDKYTLGIASVGLFGGKSISKKFCGLQSVFHTRLSDFLFFSTGIPAVMDVEKIRSRLVKGADKLVCDISESRKRPLMDKISFFFDRTILRKLMIERNPEFYANVIKSWSSKGYVSVKQFSDDT